ncbi:hypothetical protein H8S90_13215 [Olivibacter sp. SDN3]|uniref:TolB family protein n=1 Tax=Olivibacter sp. SDN3 TaxID=2764720 RepID=UPI0016512088|nr:hypothetical protein [Olivibacter sp. SDN3]QNL47781.1 hypothetical protein H8S90_13215 [Olivibacter sp. SDN3]
MTNLKIHKYIIIKYLICYLLTISTLACLAQIFDDNQNPPSVKWRQIKTEHFQIIYATEFEDGAQTLTNILENSIKRVSKSIGIKPRKISIILQNRDVVSNGFVQLAPRRSEFATTPPQQMDYQDWLNSLAIHELRHVVQFDGLSGHFKPPLLEQLGLAIFGVTLPPWFYEGDAVAIETVLTPSGRGRLPSWELPFRTNTLSNLKYSYQKDFLGSLKSITPGYYELGYFMTTKMRRDYGEDFINQLMKDMVKKPLRPYNFSRALVHATGYNTKSWHRKTVQELDSLWREQLQKTSPITYEYFPHTKPQEIVDYLLPQALPSGEIIALQRSYHSVPKIVILSKENTVKEVIKTGIQTHPHFSYGGGKIIWDEMRYDKRYHKRSFHVINSYNLATKSYRQLSFKTRLFSPTVSPDGKTIATVEIDLSNQVNLILLDSDTGAEKKRITIPSHIMIQTPSFDKEGKNIIATATSSNGTSLIEINSYTEETNLLIDWQEQQIERPIYTPFGIVFKAHYNGIDNIYCLEPSKNIRQLTNVSYGAFNPSYDQFSETLYFNNYQPNGYLISKENATHFREKTFEQDSNFFISYYKPLLAQEEPITAPDSTQHKTFASSPYKEVKNLFNFHSISPVGDDFTSVRNFDLGLQLLSDNLLNTLSTRVGFNYDQNISRSDYFISATYKRWFPTFTLQYRNQAQLSNIRMQNRPDELIPLRWREHYTELRTTIPLTFNRLNTIYNTGLSLGTSFTKRYQLSLTDIHIPNFSEVRFPLLAQLYFNRNSRRSLHDLAPKWGQNFNFIYRDLTFDRRTDGSIFSMRSTLYFPGLVNNHSLQVRFNFQERSGNYRLMNDIPMVSGYDQLTTTRVNNTLFLDYRFPLIYPDWDISPLMFVKRIKTGLFADFENFVQQNNLSPRTLGLEVRADLNLLRFYLPNFDAGVRAIYVNEPHTKRLIFTYGLSYSY